MVESRPIGVVVAQLGTPDKPTASALRPYLRQFLSDRRVIDYHPFVWRPILQIILAVRPRKSAALYERIWQENGSPLLYYTKRQVELLQNRLGEQFRVVPGMTYGNPSIQSAIRQLEAEGIDRIIVFPMFPQYSSTTTASIYDAAYDAAAGRRTLFGHENKRFVPTLRFVPSYYDYPGYIEAMAAHLQMNVNAWGKTPDRYQFSFHGIPQRYDRTGDPYRQQCIRTAELLAEHMELSEDEWAMSFQSQFGPEKWLQPYTDEIIEGAQHAGIERLLLFAPGFVTDCLETVDELGNEGLEQFEEGGGHAENFRLVPCLNDNPAWIDTMEQLVRREAAGWVDESSVQRLEPATSAPERER